MSGLMDADPGTEEPGALFVHFRIAQAGKPNAVYLTIRDGRLGRVAFGFQPRSA